MSLVNCPECGHEVSAAATACPNCGHPFAPQQVKTRVVTQTVEPGRDEFPKWIFIPIGILGVVLLFILIMFLRNDDNTAQNINVNLARKESADVRDTPVRPVDTPSQVVIPPSTTSDSTIPNDVPQTIPPDTQTTVIDDGTPEKGTIRIDAKIADKQGNPQPVKDEKFYLLDKDLEMVLSEADLNSINGQTLINSFGLSIINPEKYQDFRKKSLDAIQQHVKFDTKTDSAGKAKLKNVKPGNYYLFGITKTDKGFAVWSSPVIINEGQNSLILPPAKLTDVAR